MSSRSGVGASGPAVLPLGGSSRAGRSSAAPPSPGQLLSGLLDFSDADLCSAVRDLSHADALRLWDILGSNMFDRMVVLSGASTSDQQNAAQAPTGDQLGLPPSDASGLDLSAPSHAQSGGNYAVDWSAWSDTPEPPLSGGSVSVQDLPPEGQ